MMHALRTSLIAAVLTVTAGWTSPHAAERVDLLLVLAADVSASIDEAKFQLQRSAYAAAFSNPQVMDSIRSGPNGRIAIAFVEWSGILQQKTVIDWTVISDGETARHLAISSSRHRARSKKTAHRSAPGSISR